MSSSATFLQINAVVWLWCSGQGSGSDSSQPRPDGIARLKAYTARTRDQTTLQFKALTHEPENEFLKQIPVVVAVGDGVPIEAGNEPIGGLVYRDHPAAINMRRAQPQELQGLREVFNEAC